MEEAAGASDTTTGTTGAASPFGATDKLEQIIESARGKAEQRVGNQVVATRSPLDAIMRQSAAQETHDPNTERMANTLQEMLANGIPLATGGAY